MSKRVVILGLVALLVCGALVTGAEARVDDAGWRSIKVDFGQRWATDKPAAVRALGDADRLESVKMLVKLLGWKDSAINRKLH